MTDKLKAKLLQLAQQMEQQPDVISDELLFSAIRQLYESSIVIQHLMRLDATSTNSDLQLQEEDLRKALSNLEIESETQQAEPKTEQHEEIPPLMDTIKNMVTEMPEASILDAFQEAEENLQFVKKEVAPQETVSTGVKDNETTLKKNLNDQYSKTLKIDRNDQLAFTNHLFNQTSADYQKAISQIVSMETWEEVEHFVCHILKPDYNHWEGKEFYEERFLSVLNGYFSE